MHAIISKGALAELLRANALLSESSHSRLAKQKGESITIACYAYRFVYFKSNQVDSTGDHHKENTSQCPSVLIAVKKFQTA